MRFLLAAVNAKYIHSNLAVYSLRAFAKNSCLILRPILRNIPSTSRRIRSWAIFLEGSRSLSGFPAISGILT